MKSDNRDIVTNLKSRLPEFEPDNSLWVKIEEQLDFDLRIKSAIADLPEYLPQSGTWSSIEKKIPKPNNTIALFIKWTAVAASVAILVSFIAWEFKKSNSYDVLVETEMVSTDNDNNIQLLDEREDMIAMIDRLCITNNSACNTPDFKEKIGLYHELEEEQQQIEKTIRRIGESPEMVKALIRIENLKSTTIQELITIANS